MIKSFSPSYYVGIGFSVDNLQALNALLCQLDDDTGACFILVPSLSFSLTSINQLDLQTNLPIFEVENGVSVQANTIYVLPQDKYAKITEDDLFLTQAISDTSIHLPIDTFFDGLAKSQADRAIGVLLSGTGTDGRLGLNTLKTLGQLTIVQQTCLAACDVNIADAVLLPDKMGQYLSRFLYNPFLQTKKYQAVDRLQYLERQLEKSREYLHEALNDMALSQKELQQVKQELHRTTLEHQKKISEVIQVNEDLDHVLEFIDPGIVFLDNNLLIRRFTATATEYLDLTEADIMRSIFHVTLSFDYKAFFDDIRQVVKTKLMVQKNIVGDDGQWTVIIVPYTLSESEEISGLAIIFNDESQHGFFESALNVTYRELHNSIRNALDLLDTQPSRQKLDVLLVDDNDADILLVQRQFMRCTDCVYAMHVAQTGEAALELVRSEKIDICVIDYRLQHETAIEVTHMLRENGYAIPVIVITGYPEDTLYAELLSHSILDMIHKDDITPQLISRSIRYAIRRHEINSSIDKVLNSPMLAFDDTAVH